MKRLRRKCPRPERQTTSDSDEADVLGERPLSGESAATGEFSASEYVADMRRRTLSLAGAGARSGRSATAVEVAPRPNKQHAPTASSRSSK